MGDMRMIDNEIIKAWECCTSERTNSCFKCPFYKLCDDDNFFLVKATLDLINRQKAEIERLEGCVKSEDEVREIMKSQMSSMIKKVMKERIDETFALAKAEAVKEFAERLKKISDIFGDIPGWRDVITNEMDIDNLVKEMVGEV